MCADVPGSPRSAPQGPPGKWRRLTMDGALDGLECVFEAIDLVSQPIALATQLVPLLSDHYWGQDSLNEYQ